MTEEQREQNREYQRNWARKNAPKTRQKYYANHEENKRKRREQSRNWRAKNPDKALKQGQKDNLKRYGLTIKQYDEILIIQNYSCATCGNNTETLCIDHDHITGQIRKLLCRNCNIALGLLKENKQTILNLLEYLSEYGIVKDLR